MKEIGFRAFGVFQRKLLWIHEWILEETPTGIKKISCCNRSRDSRRNTKHESFVEFLDISQNLKGFVLPWSFRCTIPEGFRKGTPEISLWSIWSNHRKKKLDDFQEELQEFQWSSIRDFCRNSRNNCENIQEELLMKSFRRKYWRNFKRNAQGNFRKHSRRNCKTNAWVESEWTP